MQYLVIVIFYSSAVTDEMTDVIGEKTVLLGAF